LKLLRDFLCEHCGTEKERYIDSDITQIVCDECGNTAIRLIGMPTVALDGTDPGFPGAFEKWADKRAQRTSVRKSKSYYAG